MTTDRDFARTVKDIATAAASRRMSMTWTDRSRFELVEEIRYLVREQAHREGFGLEAASVAAELVIAILTIDGVPIEDATINAVVSRRWPYDQ